MAKKYPPRPCVICSKENIRRGVTCSIECQTIMRSNTAKKKPLTCEFCQATFFSKDGKGRYCPGPHYKTCEICKKDFAIPRGSESKKKPTCGPKCGAFYSHRDPKSKEKRRLNNLKKHGVEYTFQREDVKAKIKENPNYKNTLYRSKGFEDLMIKKYGVKNAFLLPHAVPGRVSSHNLRWKELLETTTGLEWELERSISGKINVDLYCENKGVKLAVEIHPTPTHNSYKNLIACNRRGCVEFPCLDHSKVRTYHQDRAFFLKDLGIELVSVFDWMAEDRIVEFIKSKLRLTENRIGARKTILKKISQKEANRFLKEFHMMGPSRKQTHCYGLFAKEELIQVQTFVELEEGVWEARRLASKDNWQIIGGVSKGTKAFIKEVNPDSIIAYSDLNLSFAGFDSEYSNFEKTEVVKPSKCWSQGSRMILAKSAAFQSADRLIGIASNSKESPYPEEMTNDEVFLAEGWLPVWDCGKIKEVWNNV